MTRSAGFYFCAIAALFAIVQSAHADTTSEQTKPGCEPAGYSGEAEMAADGTISLWLTHKDTTGVTIKGPVILDPKDPSYKKTLDHIGKLSPGKPLTVKPWCDG